MDPLGAATRGEKTSRTRSRYADQTCRQNDGCSAHQGRLGRGSLPEGVAGAAEGPHGVAAGGFRAAAGEGDGGRREEAAKTLAGRLAFGANGEEL